MLSLDDEKKQITSTLPSPWATGLATSIIQRCAGSDRLIEQARLGAEWLSGQELPEGGWPIFNTSDAEGDLFSTVIALEVLRSSGLDSGSEQIQRGEDWLISQQQAFGNWELKGCPYDFTTSVVLNYFDQRENLTPLPVGILRKARDFIFKGIELSRSNNHADHSLALVALYHGVELFLYGVFSELEPQIPIFREKQTSQTIGLRVALVELQKRLIHDGMIKTGGTLKYQNQLSGMAGDRDQIVHQGSDIRSATVDQYVEQSITFVRFYSEKLLSEDILR
jgi:hypothetical protein